MGSFSPAHWMIVLAVVVLLFGGGKISKLAGDLGKSIRIAKKEILPQTEEIQQEVREINQQITKEHLL